MRVLLVGAGGYAINYINILLDLKTPSIVWEGIVDPYYSASPSKERIDAVNIPVYDTMEEFYAKHTADLAIICTPTFLHCEQSIYALSQGSYVLCEKPAAPTVEDALQMLEAERKYGRFIAIGYQWSFSEAMQSLKADILQGLFGAPKAFKTIVCWPRTKAYYARGGGWGGKIRKDGRMVLDSIASNACAHYLHNMLFVLGDTMETSAVITDIQAECYRANAIENFDTCSIKMKTEKGTPLYFAATHAPEQIRDPEFEYTFEKAKVLFSQSEGSIITAEFTDGTKKVYGNPFANSLKKFRDSVAAAEGTPPPVCTVQTAIPHVRVIESLYKTVPIRTFAGEHICLNQETDAVYVKGLFQQVCNAYEKELLFSETGSELFTSAIPD